MRYFRPAALPRSEVSNFTRVRQSWDWRFVCSILWSWTCSWRHKSDRYCGEMQSLRRWLLRDSCCSTGHAYAQACFARAASSTCCHFGQLNPNLMTRHLQCARSLGRFSCMTWQCSSPHFVQTWIAELFWLWPCKPPCQGKGVFSGHPSNQVPWGVVSNRPKTVQQGSDLGIWQVFSTDASFVCGIPLGRWQNAKKPHCRRVCTTDHAGCPPLRSELLASTFQPAKPPSIHPQSISFFGVSGRWQNQPDQCHPTMALPDLWLLVCWKCHGLQVPAATFPFSSATFVAADAARNWCGRSHPAGALARRNHPWKRTISAARLLGQVLPPS